MWSEWSNVVQFPSEWIAPAKKKVSHECPVETTAVIPLQVVQAFLDALDAQSFWCQDFRKICLRSCIDPSHEVKPSFVKLNCLTFAVSDLGRSLRPKFLRHVAADICREWWECGANTGAMSSFIFQKVHQEFQAVCCLVALPLHLSFWINRASWGTADRAGGVDRLCSGGSAGKYRGHQAAIVASNDLKKLRFDDLMISDLDLKLTISDFCKVSWNWFDPNCCGNGRLINELLGLDEVTGFWKCFRVDSNTRTDDLDG